MSFFKSLFKSKGNQNTQPKQKTSELPINSYSDFWKWFVLKEATFHNVVKTKGDFQNDFFAVMTPKLKQLKDGFWFLTGMFDQNTAELIITADGDVKNIPFIEELVAAAPDLPNWKITALKQPTDILQYGIQIGEFKFNNENMSFYPIEHKYMPDEIDIVIAHEDFSLKNQDTIGNGVFLTLDNYLGELNSVTTIDNVSIINPKDAEKELIPFKKIKEFLVWREKEFIEKYKGVRKNTDNDGHSSLEATLPNGLPLLAIINMDLLHWDSKASHPWVIVLDIKYDGSNNNGMPDKTTYSLLNEIEEDIVRELKDVEGYLNIGRQTADSSREVYFACKDFRKPAKVLHAIQKKYQDKIELSFDIYKDKYWQTFNRFMPR